MAAAATTNTKPEPAIKVQTVGDDLRLPCFVNPADTTDLLTAMEPLRKTSMPFQSKHLPALKRNTWYALKRPADKSRTGLLCVWPTERCCVYISGEPVSPKRPVPRVILLRLRVDPQFFAHKAGATVFAATLCPAKRTLWMEDTLMWKGRNVEEPFSVRYRMAEQWLEHYCIQDSRLIGGLELELAPWSALTDVSPEGVWELQSDDIGRKRLLWIANMRDPTPVLAGVSSAAAPPVLELSAPVTTSPVPTAAAAATSAPTLVVSSLVAIATRENGPDQWVLTSADGVSLGRALIRTMAVSSQLRSFASGTTRVDVEWNATFGKWEIRGLTTAPANHSSFFTVTK
jgi:hypothetical protein